MLRRPPAVCRKTRKVSRVKSLPRLPTSFDVAALAGVSQPTVSLAFRNSPRVRPQTRERILHAAETIGYVPDQRAVRLRGQRTGSVAVVILLPSGTSPADINPLYWDLLGAVERRADRMAYRIILSFQHDATVKCDFEAGREADATIVLGSAAASDGWRHFEKLFEQGRNIAAWAPPRNIHPAVRCDNHVAARIATRHLVASGAKNVVFLGPGHQTHLAFHKRRQACQQTLNEIGLKMIDAGGIPFGSRHHQARFAVMSLLNAHVQFDGIFAACDLLAFGAIEELMRHKLRVPLDVAVIGIDGLRSGRYAFPQLTSVEHDTVSAGRELFDLAISQASGFKRSKALVSTSLRDRGSV